MDEVYPLKDSLAAVIYASSEEELDDRFSRAEGNAPEVSPPPEHLSAFRPERSIGWTLWKAPELDLFIHTQIPPLQSTPASVMITFRVEENENFYPKLKELGFPVPDSDPAFIVGERHHEEGKSTAWVPGPGDLACLIFRAQVAGSTIQLSVHSELGLEGEDSDQVRDAVDWIDWEGTLRFRNREQVLAGDVEEHIRPGRIRARFIV